MKYSIFYLIKGKAGLYNQKLVKEVGPKFGENYMVENHLPAHITLKSPFEFNDEKKLENLIKEFAKNQKKAKIEFGGFGNFRRFVSFLKVNSSKEAKKVQKDLIKEFSKLGVESHEFDKKFHPHSTIAYGNTPETFDKIWGHIKKLEEKKFNLVLDNIAIMKKTENGWKVHKEFKLK